MDGSIVAAAVAGRDVSPVSDIATPTYKFYDCWIQETLSARAWITSMHLLSLMLGVRFLRNRHLLSRFSSILLQILTTALTRDPRIVEVKHFVQQGMEKST